MLRTLLIMMIAGWAAAGTPFRGDQALFTVYARELDQGKVLYRDLWEVTGPGIFWFYEAAGCLFGFTEDGIHLGEWLWFTMFVYVLGLVMVKRFDLDRWPQSPALFIGAWYYFTSCADPSHLTKVEGLVAFPMFFSLLAATQGRNPWWLLLAGLAGGVVILFKIAFGVLLLAGWFAVLLNHRPLLSWRLFFLPLGMASVLALALLQFLHTHSLDFLLRTLFIDPREMLASAELAPYVRLASSLRWFVETSTPLLVLAVSGSLLLRFDPLVRCYWCMSPVALVVILIQRWSWWSYHFLILSLPLAVLAAYTAPAVQEWLYLKLPSRRERLAVYGLIAVLFLAPLGHGSIAYLRLLGTPRQEARMNSGNAYRFAAAEANWLASQPSGTVFVAGDPLILFLSGRQSVTRIHGWSFELLSPRLWQELRFELEYHSPRFIYLDRGDFAYESQLAKWCPEFLIWLHEHYRIVQASKHGNWWERLK